MHSDQNSVPTATNLTNQIANSVLNVGWFLTYDAYEDAVIDMQEEMMH